MMRFGYQDPLNKDIFYYFGWADYKDYVFAATGIAIGLPKYTSDDIIDAIYENMKLFDLNTLHRTDLYKMGLRYQSTTTLPNISNIITNVMFEIENPWKFMQYADLHKTQANTYTMPTLRALQDFLEEEEIK